MRTCIAVFLLCACFSLQMLLAQTSGNETVSVGYQRPIQVPAAPGQMVALFVRGLKAQAAEASSLPLPTTLAGVTVSFAQAGRTGNMPIFRVIPQPDGLLGCFGGSSNLCGLTAVIVQIPTELQICAAGCSGCIPNPCIGGPIFFAASVIENGTPGQPFQFVPVIDQIHIINSCDAVSVPSGFCYPHVYHGNGARVTGIAPARPGEVIVIYVVGAGPTNPSVASGVAAPNPPAISIVNWNLGFDFQIGALALGQSPAGLIPVTPLFVGLVPGLVGLYQVNLRIPAQLPPGLAICGAFEAGWNTTVRISGGFSSDSVQVCVQP